MKGEEEPAERRKGRAFFPPSVAHRKRKLGFAGLQSETAGEAMSVVRASPGQAKVPASDRFFNPSLK